MKGMITAVEHGPAFVVVTVQAGDRRQIVPVDAAAWTALVARCGGPEQVIGARVDVFGSGAAAGLRFGDEG